MATKRSKGRITGLLALTMEAQVALKRGDWVSIVGDYEVGLADGTKPVLGSISVSNTRGRTSTVMGTEVGVPVVPGDVTVEARGFYVKTEQATGGAFAAGVAVGINADSELVAVAEGVAEVGISLMASTGAGDEADVLVR